MDTQPPESRWMVSVAPRHHGACGPRTRDRWEPFVSDRPMGLCDERLDPRFKQAERLERFTDRLRMFFSLTWR